MITEPGSVQAPQDAPGRRLRTIAESLAACGFRAEILDSDGGDAGEPVMVEVIHPASRAYAEITIDDGYLALSCWSDPSEDPDASALTSTVIRVLGHPGHAGS